MSKSKPLPVARLQRLTATAMALIAIAAVPLAVAAGPIVVRENSVELAYGEKPGPHAVVSFNKDRAATAALKIETFLAGVDGSKVSIFIDNDPAPVFVHTLKGDECRFDNDKSHCTIVLKGRVATYGRLTDGFRKGRISRLQVETGGVMAMSHTTELKGFSQAMQAIK